MAYTGKKLESKLYDVYTKSETDLSIQTNSTPTAVSDKTNTSTGYFSLPSGTTAERPASPQSGFSRYNTDSGSLEFYDGTNWIATNLIPTVNSVDGTIYSGVTSSLTLNVTNATDVVDVKYYEGGVLLATDASVAVAANSCTVNVPAAVYGQSGGDTIAITIFNQDGTPASNSINKTVQGLPTGGTITVLNGYRYHKFNSSDTLTVPANFSKSAEAIILAGGGGGGSHMGGGGGAGGLLTPSFTLNTTLSVTVGTGGAGGTGSGGGDAASGGNSVLGSFTALGGGGGSNGEPRDNSGASGGSGGGNTGYSSDGLVGGSGTSGQGNSGGTTVYGDGPEYLGTGGGGYSSSGTSGTIDPNYCGNGGSGYTVPAGWDTIYGRSSCAGGGGGGGVYSSYSEPVYGGSGVDGGGNGSGWTNSTIVNGTTTAGAQYSGGGGGAARYNDFVGGNGGSGIVIIRYQL